MNPESTPLARRITLETGTSGDRLTPARGDGALAPEPPIEWQHLWFAIARERWSALAIVPAQSSLSTLATARRLVAVGQAYSAAGVQLVDATSADPAAARAATAEMARCATSGEQCIVALSSPLTKPASIAIARAAGSALLLVPLGSAELRAARDTIACIGREHFLGAISVHRRP